MGLLHANGIDAVTGMPAALPIAPSEAIGLDASRLGDPKEVSRLSRTWSRLAAEAPRPASGSRNQGQRPGLGRLGRRVRSRLAGPHSRGRRAVDRAPRRDRRLAVPAASVSKCWRSRLTLLLMTGSGSSGAHRSDVDPTKLPFYVTFVGPPASIPFEHQSELDLAYAVGRLCFDQTEGYRRYVESVIAYETAAAPPHGREVAFWGTRNRGDRRDRVGRRLPGQAARRS